MTNGWSYLKTLVNTNQENVKLKSLEEGKSDFLQIVSSFKSEDDAIVFLNWIKNDALEKLLSNLHLAGIRNRPHGGARILATDNFQTENHDDVEPKSSSVLVSKLKQELIIPPETDTKDNSDNFEFEPEIYSEKEKANFQTENNDVEKSESSSVWVFPPETETITRDNSDDSDNFEFEPDIIKVEFSDETIFNEAKKFTQKQNQPKNIDNQFHYKCEECGKTFITPSKLERHSFTHSGLQPYQCNLCQKSYNQSGNLKVHIKNQHKDYLNNEDDPLIIPEEIFVNLDDDDYPSPIKERPNHLLL